MTYVRTKTINGKQYRYLQKSKRVGGKVITQHVKYLGPVNPSSRNIGTTQEEKRERYIPGTDPINTITEQDNKRIDDAIKRGNLEIKQSGLYENIKEAGDEFDKGNSTKSKYYDPKVERYKPQRAKIHEKILKKLDNLNAFPEKGNKPQAIFIGGLSASGKSTVAVGTIPRRKEKGWPDWEQYPSHVYLNADNVKELLPEYNGYNAGILHEESSDIYDEAVSRARDNGQNVILDATLKTTWKAKDSMDKFKDKGYEIILLGTNLKGDKAIERATKRFLRSKRYVPLEFIGKNAKQTNRSVLMLRHYADDYKIMDTDFPLGGKPKLIESKQSITKDRQKTSKKVVDSESEWRKLGTDKVDLKGYDTKKYKKVKKEL